LHVGAVKPLERFTALIPKSITVAIDHAAVASYFSISSLKQRPILFPVEMHCPDLPRCTAARKRFAGRSRRTHPAECSLIFPLENVLIPARRRRIVAVAGGIAIPSF
jgi:hypothetical protein